MAVLAWIFKIAKHDTSLFPNEKYQNIPNFSASSIDYSRILKKFENNPWIRITVLNYTLPMKDNPCLFTAWADRHFSDSFCWLLRIISATPVDAFAIGVSPEKINRFINESCNHTKLYPNQSHISQVLQTFEKRCSLTQFGQTKNGV